MAGGGGSGPQGPSGGQDLDQTFMAAAMRLAARGLGVVAPNPSVGCVLVQFDDCGGWTIVGRGRTGRGGRPHGEAVALEAAGSRARGATAYVTLEPCAHHGKTPPCAEALVKAGVARVVIAVTDPDPRVAGRGIARLKDAGIEVREGVLAEEGGRMAAGFFRRVEAGRPLVTLKLATSLDGRIAAKGGSSRWITGELARRHAHGERGAHDGIMVGSATAILDNPMLTCRLPGLEDTSPIRVIVDSHLRLPLTHKLVTTAQDHPTWMLCATGAPTERRKALEAAGVEIMALPLGADGGLDLAAGMTRLGERGLTRLMVEGGGRLAAACLRGGFADRLLWYRAPLILGGDGVPAVADLGLGSPVEGPRFQVLDHRRLGEDRLDIFEIAPKGDAGSQRSVPASDLRSSR